MTSSIFNSETRLCPETALNRRWRRWNITFFAVLFGVGGLLYILLLLIDPYDTGRFINVGIVGIDDHTPRTADVSRGRDPRFDAAVFGNSTGQLVDPSRLNAGTGLSFVQLTVPGTGPHEQLALLRWFVSRHDHIGALVMVTDESWCASDANLPLNYPFPFWLYGSDFGYLANLLNWKSIDHAAWRIQLALGQRQRSDPVGYSDYSAEKITRGFVAAPAQPDLTRAEADAGFPWIDELGRAAGTLLGIPIILVMPPVHHSLLPPSGSLAAARLDRCKRALVQTVAGRPRSGFVDFRRDTPETRDQENFFDVIHYRNNIAREIEERVTTMLGRFSSVSR
jgi:hypothetical protein